jgi:hydroxymethylglutaryl-CoA lyase
MFPTLHRLGNSPYFYTMESVKIIECPRDAMQGITEFIPTETKIRYINQLLKCGFDTLDFGSFVSPKAIPQLRDTAEVLSKLELGNSNTKLLAIIANERGAQEASQFDEIHYLGYPFSVSETFQLRNTNTTIAESWEKLAFMQNLSLKHNKELVVYLSMGFGNPYGDAWNADIVIQWSEKLHKELGIKILALSDTIGTATEASIDYLFKSLIPALPDVEFGAHLHTVPERAADVIAAAYNSGCRRFDGAIKGFGGCPMAADDLTGNMPTERMLSWLESQNVTTGVQQEAFQEAMALSSQVFPLTH